jgi:uncharacterized protein YuzE
MAGLALKEYIDIIPAVTHAPQRFLWSSYDKEADVLYINFKKPSRATDSEMREDDVIVRYDGEEVIGLTILHLSKRKHPRPTRRSTGRAHDARR